jgi:uroporphyrinogen decarboxylase
MTDRDRIIKSLTFQDTDIVPWHMGFTHPCKVRLQEYYGTEDLDPILGNHLAGTGADLPDGYREVRPGFWRDEFGVLWDRTVDEDIGNPCEFVLPEPTLAGYNWPDPTDPQRYVHVKELFEKGTDKFVVADFGFSLFERAWTMRGMDKILMDMIEHEEFLDELLDTITDWNLEAVRRILEFPVDGVEFGDDWGSQRGLIMGPALWRRFVKPRIARLYGEVRKAGRKVFIHSCGDVDELFDDLVEVGLNVFNPFQPEVMDTFALAKQYKGRLAFWGGISTQRLLPYGTPAEVRAGVADILKRIGAGGGYIAAPAHATPKDVPTENLVAMIETITKQRKA